MTQRSHISLPCSVAKIDSETVALEQKMSMGMATHSIKHPERPTPGPAAAAALGRRGAPPLSSVHSGSQAAHVQLGGEQALRRPSRPDPTGRFSFWSLLPSSFRIQADGPVGRMPEAQGWHR